MLFKFSLKLDEKPLETGFVFGKDYKQALNNLISDWGDLIEEISLSLIGEGDYSLVVPQELVDAVIDKNFY